MPGKLSVCKTCGAAIAKNARICPSCGARQCKPIYRRWWFWSIIVVVVLGFIGGLGNKRDDETPTVAATTTAKAGTTTTHNDVESIINQDFDLSGYRKIDAETLYEYGAYLTGEKIVTVISVTQADDDAIKADTENGKEFSFDLSFSFDTDTVDKQVSEGETLTVAGTVSDLFSALGVVSLQIDDCVIVGHGELAGAIDKEKVEQIKYCEGLKSAQDRAAAAAIAAEKDDYIAACQIYAYKDVERNPDSYKGKQIKVTGTVIQVSEGLFDSVVLRVEDNNGDTWYVTYTHREGESRILEDDRITCYGECTGVTSYTNVLGSQVTIPSLKMVYYK